ncbi:MAG TPA: vanadium-dependent haloperoxidase [Polyangiaceae bacterium]|nr:vanadium-dependent haloperoxidase [Polyangiaceae bacterium]
MRIILNGAALTLAALLPLNAQADVVTDWNQTTVDEIRKLGLGPNPASRTLAIAHIAAYEAVNSLSKTHEPYRATLRVNQPASPEAAAASAFHLALVLLLPAEKPTLDAAYAQSLADIPDDPARSNGIALGESSAVAIFTERIGDGSAVSASYPGSTDPGQWRPTPSLLQAALEPGWRSVKPFALPTPQHFRPAAPPAITSPEFATAYLETQSLGKSDSATRSVEQTNIANFWKQATHVPLNAVARSVAKVRGLSLAENARLFALLNITVADTRIAVWDAKYEYGFWRPITAINTTTDYGNAAAVPDAAWAPLIETPNHPEYPSGHSTTGGGGFRALATFFGGDAQSFAVGSDTASGVTRGFETFSSAEQENADSRIYGGIHYRFSNEIGLALGHQIADYVSANYLKELPPPDDTGQGGEGGEAGAGNASTGGHPTGGSSSTGGDRGDDLGGAAGATGGASAAGGGSKGGASAAGSGGKPPAPPLPDPGTDQTNSCSMSANGGHWGLFGTTLALCAALFTIRRRSR